MENPSAGAGALEVGDLQIGILSDVYMGGVWVASLDRFARMAEALGDRALADGARAIRARASATLESKLWNAGLGQYAFALLQDGSVNANLTSWPATAMSFAVFDTVHGAEMASRLASSNITTDWGARPLSATSTLFDPLHYNNGAVWPFVTGFVSLAQYQYHNATAGLFALQAIARTGFDQSLGRNPEVISGRLYKPLDTAVPHQFFATSMVLTPLIRGLLGIDVDVPRGRVTIAPHLPPAWDSVTVEHVPVGRGSISFTITRRGDLIAASVRREGPDRTPIDLVFSPALPLGARVVSVGSTVTTTPGDLHATVQASLTTTTSVGVRFTGGWNIIPPAMPATIGSRSRAPRVLSERLGGDGARYVVAMEGLNGQTYAFTVRAPDASAARTLGAEVGVGARATVAGVGAKETERTVSITFPSAGANADGYSATTVTFTRTGAP
jgi:mannosylglycerate hydrolase MGH1-like protein